jgi:MYXO-CTERM domain-containing protein
LTFPGFENLAADTFVTHGVAQQPIDNLGFDPDFEMLPNGIIGGWFDSNPITPTLPDRNGQILIMQLTVPSSATCLGIGTIFYEDSQIPGTATPGDGLICWPSPGALPLIALAALRASRRR